MEDLETFLHENSLGDLVLSISVTVCVCVYVYRQVNYQLININRKFSGRVHVNDMDSPTEFGGWCRLSSL